MIQWSEKDLEDWLCSPAEEGGQWRLCDVLGDIIPQQGRPWKAARQIPLGNMRADILIAWPDYLAVIELKCNPATNNDLEQILRYQAWLEGRLWHRRFAQPSGSQGPQVLAYLIAPSFNESICIAALNASVRLHEVRAAWVVSDEDCTAALDFEDYAETTAEKYIRFASGIEKSPDATWEVAETPADAIEKEQANDA